MERDGRTYPGPQPSRWRRPAGLGHPDGAERRDATPSAPGCGRPSARRRRGGRAPVPDRRSASRPRCRARRRPASSWSPSRSAASSRSRRRSPSCSAPISARRSSSRPSRSRPPPSCPFCCSSASAIVSAAKSSFWQQIGRIVIGLALMILSLGLIVGASQPLRDHGVFTLVMERLAGDPDPGARHGGPVHLARPFERRRDPVRDLARERRRAEPSARARPRARRQCRVRASSRSGSRCARRRRRSASCSAISRSGSSARWSALVAADLRRGARCRWLGADPARADRQRPYGLQRRCSPSSSCRSSDRSRGSSSASCAMRENTADKRVNHLDDSALDRPALALANATREVMRLADTVELMLQEAILTFREGDESRRVEISRLDNDVDRLQEDDQALSHAPDAPAARRGGHPPLLRPDPLHDQPGACRRHHRPRPPRACREAPAQRRLVLGAGLGGDRGAAPAGRRADAPRRHGLRHPRPRARTRAGGREGPHPRERRKPRPRAISSACATARSPRSRRARCISTSCAT